MQVDNLLLQMLLAQTVDEMCQRGHVPYFLMGGYRAYRALGAAYNQVTGAFAEERGY